MTKMDYTVRGYKADKRLKCGEKLVFVTTVKDVTEDAVKAVVETCAKMNPDTRYEYTAAMMKVKNLMTGKEVEIPSDTPWCCNPASETYWSM